MSSKYKVVFIGEDKDQFRTTDGLWCFSATNLLTLDSYDEAAVIRDFLIRDEGLSPTDVVVRSDY